MDCLTFLRYMDRLKTNDLDFAEASVLGDDDDSVVMMTMHKSKGLEFPVVFVSGLANRFSNLDALSPVTVNADSYLAGYAIDRKNRAKKKNICKSGYAQCHECREAGGGDPYLICCPVKSKREVIYDSGGKRPRNGKGSL